MFKPKKKELKFAEVKKPKEVEDNSITEEDESEYEDKEGLDLQRKNDKYMEDIKVPKPIKEEVEESEDEKKQARIVSARIVEGMVIETIIHSTFSLGEVGDYFEQ
jgi:hypothetical protein